MKKLLSASALLCLAAAGQAQAQTNVSIYGLIDANVSYNNAGRCEWRQAVQS